jgi:hypothetical protein
LIMVSKVLLLMNVQRLKQFHHLQGQQAPFSTTIHEAAEV